MWWNEDVRDEVDDVVLLVKFDDHAEVDVYVVDDRGAVEVDVDVEVVDDIHVGNVVADLLWVDDHWCWRPRCRGCWWSALRGDDAKAEDVEVGNDLNENDVVESDVDFVDVNLDAIHVNVGSLYDDVVDVYLLLVDVDVDDSPDFFADVVVVDDVVNDNVNDDVESYDVDDDSAVVDVDELFKGDANNDDDDDESDVVVDYVVDYVKRLVLQDVDDDNGDDDCCGCVVRCSDAYKSKKRVDEVVIVEDAIKGVMAKDVSEDVNVNLDVIVEGKLSRKKNHRVSFHLSIWFDTKSNRIVALQLHME